MQHTKQFRSSTACFSFQRLKSKTPPDPCAYCIGRLPLLPVVATLRLPPSLNSLSARAHNFGNTPSSYVFPRFFPTLAQGCFPFSFFWLTIILFVWIQKFAIKFVLMKYTKFFSSLVNTAGSPNLDNDQFKKLMNIIHFEGQIAGVDKVINKFKSIDGEHKYNSIKADLETKLESITNGLSPAELLESWR
jgi:hypothetical protein